MRKAIAALATAAIVLGGFSAALVLQSPDIASAQEVETESTNATVPTAIEDVLADLVEDGVITEEQSSQIAAALQERVGHFRGHRGGLDRGGHLETVAGVIDVDVTALVEALRRGGTGEIGLDASQAGALDHRTDIVQHDAGHEARTQGAKDHRNDPAARCADDGRFVKPQGFGSGKHVARFDQR